MRPNDDRSVTTVVDRPVRTALDWLSTPLTPAWAEGTYEIRQSGAGTASAWAFRSRVRDEDGNRVGQTSSKALTLR